MKMIFTTKSALETSLNSLYQESEYLFLDPDGTRKRFPIGWKGVGRYLPGSLQVIDNTTGNTIDKGNIKEEDNGVWFEFADALPAGSYKDLTVKYIPRPDDVAFSKGITGSKYEGEEYFLFPNWIEGKGCGDAFWVGKYEASRKDASTSSQGSSNILQSKKGVRTCTNVTYSSWDGLVANKGNQFHRIRNREWVNILLWCNKLGLDVRGNAYGYTNSTTTNMDGYGTDLTGHTEDYYKAYTGSGPITWNHNQQEGGIADLVGNVWEATAGLKIINNVIWIFDENNNLVNTGVSLVNNIISGISNGTAYGGKLYNNSADELWKEGLPTTDSTNFTNINLEFSKDDGFLYNTSGTRLLYRGGACNSGSSAGLAAFNVSTGESDSYWSTGSRLAKDLD